MKIKDLLSTHYRVKVPNERIQVMAEIFDTLDEYSPLVEKTGEEEIIERYGDLEVYAWHYTTEVFTGGLEICIDIQVDERERNKVWAGREADE